MLQFITNMMGRGGDVFAGLLSPLEGVAPLLLGRMSLSLAPMKIMRRLGLP
jgi:hypothetical protein